MKAPNIASTELACTGSTPGDGVEIWRQPLVPTRYEGAVDGGLTTTSRLRAGGPDTRPVPTSSPWSRRALLLKAYGMGVVHMK